MADRQLMHLTKSRSEQKHEQILASLELAFDEKTEIFIGTFVLKKKTLCATIDFVKNQSLTGWIMGSDELLF